MRASILKQSKFLIVSVQGSMTDADLVQLREELGAGVRRHRSTGVIVDVTMLDVMDSFAVRTLRGIAQMVKLLGAECIVVGIQPERRIFDGAARSHPGRYHDGPRPGRRVERPP